MLEMIKQLMPLHTTTELAKAAPAQRAGADGGPFDLLLGGGARPAAKTEPVRAERPGDARPELGSGWETADAADYSEPELAAAGAAQQPQPNQANPPSAEPAAEPSAAQAVEPATAEQPVATEGQAQPSAEGRSAGQLAVQTLVEELPQTPSAPEPTLPNRTAEVAAAPETGGGTPDPASTEASAPAVLQAPSEEAVRLDGPIIEAQAPPERQPRPAADAPVAEPSAQAPRSPADAPAEQPARPAPPSATAQVQPPAITPPAPSDRQDTSRSHATSSAAGPAPAPVDPTAGVGAQAVEAALVQPTQAAQARPSEAAPVQALAPAAAEAVGANAAADVDVDQLASRAVRWQRLGMLDGNGSARIRLSPPELGSVLVALRTAGDSVRVHMTVETETVRQLLQRHSERLTESLQSHGLQPGRIEVVVQTPADDGAEGGDGHGGQGQSRNEGQNGRQDSSGQRQGRSFRQYAEQELNLTA